MASSDNDDFICCWKLYQRQIRSKACSKVFISILSLAIKNVSDEKHKPLYHLGLLAFYSATLNIKPMPCIISTYKAFSKKVSQKFSKNFCGTR